jgi:MFS family permease
VTHDELEIELNPPAAPIVPPEVVPQRARQVRIPKTFSALRHRNFQLYFIGQLVSVAGTWMQIVAQAWLVYEISRSELMLGIVAAASAIPALVVSPWGGVVVERFPRRTLLMITQSVAMIIAFVLAALVFTGAVEVGHIIVMSILLGVVNSFDGPARQAFVIDMVGHEDLANAIAVNSMVFNGARVIGPAVGGVLLATLGAAWCFTINGLSFFAVILALLAMNVHPHPHSHASGSPWQQLTQGLRYVGQHRAFLGLLLLSLTFSVFGISYWTVLPAFVDKVLHQEEIAYGVINTVMGAGAVVTGLILARYGASAKRGRWLMVSALVYPVLMLAFANTSNYALALVLTLGLGMGFMMEFVLINSLLQMHVSNDMRGRVMSLYTLTFFGFAPFGNLAVGALSEAWGMARTISLSAAIVGVLAAVILVAIPEIRDLS